VLGKVSSLKGHTVHVARMLKVQWRLGWEGDAAGRSQGTIFLMVAFAPTGEPARGRGPGPQHRAFGVLCLSRSRTRPLPCVTGGPADMARVGGHVTWVSRASRGSEAASRHVTSPGDVPSYDYICMLRCSFDGWTSAGSGLGAVLALNQHDINRLTWRDMSRRPRPCPPPRHGPRRERVTSTVAHA
jgi:hypothetical protein